MEEAKGRKWRSKALNKWMDGHCVVVGEEQNKFLFLFSIK